MKKQTNAKMPAIKIAEHEQMIPTWEGVLRIYLMALVNKTERGESIENEEKELYRMARAADGYNELTAGLSEILKNDTADNCDFIYKGTISKLKAKVGKQVKGA